MLPADLERRATFPDVIRKIAEQTGGLFREDDFMPLPCAHPNCHSLTYAYRAGGAVVPLTRFIDARQNLDLLANGITFTRPRARQLIERYVGRTGCCTGNCGRTPEDLATSELLPLPPSAGGEGWGEGGVNQAAPGQQLLTLALSPQVGRGRSVDQVTAPQHSDSVAADFFARALAEQLAPSDVFRITITSFLDAYNFDLRRLMKCCIHHVLPSGHVVPFCAYNVLYRTGRVPLPRLKETVEPLNRSTVQFKVRGAGTETARTVSRNADIGFSYTIWYSLSWQGHRQHVADQTDRVIADDVLISLV